MRPDPVVVLDGAIRTLREVAAGQEDDQERARVQGVVSVLVLLRGEWDGAVASRYEVAEGYRRALRLAGAAVGEDAGPSLRAVQPVLAAALPLTVSGLETALDQLRAAVIELQTLLEAEEPTNESHAALVAELWRAEQADARSQDRYALFW